MRVSLYICVLSIITLIRVYVKNTSVLQGFIKASVHHPSSGANKHQPKNNKQKYNHPNQQHEEFACFADIFHLFTR